MGCSSSMRKFSGVSTKVSDLSVVPQVGRPTVRSSPDSIQKAFFAGTLVPDKRCPLDARQLYGLSKSWKAINRNMTVTAINIFVRLFETNAELRHLFTNMTELKTVFDLRSSKVLEDHALKVVCTIDDAIVNFDDIDFVDRLLELTSQSHCCRISTFDAAMFWRIEEPFLLAVKEELGDRFTISTETTYRTTIRYILSRMVAAFCKEKRTQVTNFHPQTRL